VLAYCALVFGEVGELRATTARDQNSIVHRRYSEAALNFLCTLDCAHDGRRRFVLPRLVHPPIAATESQAESRLQSEVEDQVVLTPHSFASGRGAAPWSCSR
jgi:hypothetical protein